MTVIETGTDADTDTVVVTFRRLPNGVGLEAPAAASALAAGADLRAAIDAPMVLAPGDRALVPTGIAMAIPGDMEAQVRPRSGLALKHGVTVLNAPGTIDADYRGEVGVILINHGSAPFTIERGDRIAQLVVARRVAMVWREVDALPDTARGAGGFGSTGFGAAGSGATGGGADGATGG